MALRNRAILLVHQNKFTRKILSQSPAISLLSRPITNRSSVSQVLFTPTSSVQNFATNTKAVKTKQVDPLVSLKKDLVSLIDEEIDSISVSDDSEIKSFLEETNFAMSEENNKIYFKKEIDNEKSLTVSFELPNDEFDEEQALMDEQREQEEGEQEEEEEPNMDRKIVLDLVIAPKSGEPLHAECSITKDKTFYIESIRFGENGRRLWVNDLSPTLSETFYNYFDTLGVGARTSSFISDYVESYKGDKAVDCLANFKKLIK